MPKRPLGLATALFVLGACGAGPTPRPEARSAAEGDPAAQVDSNLHARMEAFRHLADGDADPDVAAEASVVWKVPIAGAPVRGSALAPVTIVEFGDFQCGYCARAERTMAQIRATYGDSVRFVWRDDPLPFHDRANAAAELAREARAEQGDAGFWMVHDALLTARVDLGDAALDVLSRRLGLDPAAVAAAIARNRYEDGLDDDMELADDVGAEGTPTFFVNGRRIVGAQPFESFKTIIDDELVRTSALVRSGSPVASLYDTIIRNGRVAADPPKVSVPVPSAAPFKGDLAAPIVIQEFADFQCPYCARAEEVLGRVLSRYGSQVRLVWRDLPLPMHANAELAAEAAAEAKRQKGNAGFWAMHDKLLANEAGPHALERPALVGYAKELGLDVARFEKALDSRAHAAAVTIDAKAAAAADIHGTPAFIVGGYELDGAQPFVRFRKMIRRALGEAKP
jgi:protein-disulfide isomerase